MTKPKTLEQLRTEKERAETQLLQEQHKLERLENRKKYLEKGERTKRTHRLCNLGGTIESLAPEVKDLTRTEMTELMEHIFSLSEVQRAVRHMAITHACGSLKIAQTYGKGKYRGSAVSIFMRHEDGSVPSSDEMKKAQLQAQEQERIAWENAIPLGGKSCDVYCFDMALSVGDISDNGIGEQRKNVFKKMLSVCFVEDLDYQVEEKIQKIKTTLTSVIERYVAGEEIRIWYSYNPDELCGMYWLMKQLQPLNCQTTIYLVKLPTWEYGKENTMTSKIAWGEVSPGEWGNYITLQEKANPVFLSACAMKWNQLQNENAPLRAMLNGKLQSVSEDIYDSFILREIAEQPEQFKMAIVIGNVLGKYQLGISDVWISNRIDKMLEDGVLEIIQDAPKGETNYRRILRKRMK